LLRRYAQFAYRPTGLSLPEAWPPEPIAVMPPIGLDFSSALITPPQPFAEAERKASPNDRA
jgi:hypothetical protein